MLVQLPRLSSSLRDPFDVDQAYLQRKIILHNNNTSKSRRSGNPLDESELARKIVHGWEQASAEVRQVYKQFVGAVVELIDAEMPSEEFHEDALTAYHLFRVSLEDDSDRKITEKRLELQKVIGHAISDANVRKVASLARKLLGFQPEGHVLEKQVSAIGDEVEFGSDVVTLRLRLGRLSKSSYEKFLFLKEIEIRIFNIIIFF